MASPLAGELVWRKHAAGTSPSPHAVRATCMQLLSLVEMYCRWELQEDCSNLEGFILRFVSESELESHDLRRALLFMVRNIEEGLHASTPYIQHEAAEDLVADPFEVLQGRLAAVDAAIQTLQTQVLAVIGYILEFTFHENLFCIVTCSFVLWHPCSSLLPAVCQFGCYDLIQNHYVGIYAAFLPPFLQMWALLHACGCPRCSFNCAHFSFCMLYC